MFGRAFSKADIDNLRTLVTCGVAGPDIARQLNRRPEQVRKKVRALGLSLRHKRTNEIRLWLDAVTLAKVKAASDSFRYPSMTRCIHDLVCIAARDGLFSAVIDRPLSHAARQGSRPAKLVPPPAPPPPSLVTAFAPQVFGSA